jgi:hypothetical protein
MALAEYPAIVDTLVRRDGADVAFGPIRKRRYAPIATRLGVDEPIK